MLLAQVLVVSDLEFFHQFRVSRHMFTLRDASLVFGLEGFESPCLLTLQRHFLFTAFLERTSCTRMQICVNRRPRTRGWFLQHILPCSSVRCYGVSLAAKLQARALCNACTWWIGKSWKAFAPLALDAANKLSQARLSFSTMQTGQLQPDRLWPSPGKEPRRSLKRLHRRSILQACHMSLTLSLLVFYPCLSLSLYIIMNICTYIYIYSIYIYISIYLSVYVFRKETSMVLTAR